MTSLCKLLESFYCTVLFDTKFDCTVLFNDIEFYFCNIRQNKNKNYGTVKFSLRSKKLLWKYQSCSCQPILFLVSQCCHFEKKNTVPSLFRQTMWELKLKKYHQTLMRLKEGYSLLFKNIIFRGNNIFTELKWHTTGMCMCK